MGAAVLLFFAPDYYVASEKTKRQSALQADIAYPSGGEESTLGDSLPGQAKRVGGIAEKLARAARSGGFPGRALRLAQPLVGSEEKAIGNGTVTLRFKLERSAQTLMGKSPRKRCLMRDRLVSADASTNLHSRRRASPLRNVALQPGQGVPPLGACCR